MTHYRMVSKDGERLETTGRRNMALLAAAGYRVVEWWIDL